MQIGERMTLSAQRAGGRLLVAAACLLGAIPGAHAADTLATFRLKGSDIAVTGRLQELEAGTYRVAVPGFGVLRLEQTRYECDGDPCPGVRERRAAAQIAATRARPVPASARGALPPATEQITFADRSGLGPELIAALLRGFAEASALTFQPAGDGENGGRRYNLLDDVGSAVATVVMLAPPKAGEPAGAGLPPLDGVFAARPLVPAESTALVQRMRAQRRLYRETVLALDGLVLVVSPERKLARLDIQKAAAVLGGAARNWSDLGEATEAPLALIGGPAGDAIARLLAVPVGRPASGSPRRIEDDAELAEAVAIDGTAIGATSLAFHGKARPVTLVDRCGIEADPSVFGVKSEDYTLSRRVSLHAAVGAASSVLYRFLAYAASEPAQALVRRLSLVDQSIAGAPVHELILRSMPAHGASPSDVEVRTLARLLEKAKGAERLSATFRFHATGLDVDGKARQDVERLRAWLARPQNSGRQLLLAGFSDNATTPQANLVLTQRRAEQAKALLAGAGIGADRMAAEGFGQLNPLACNDNAEARRRNRRVEVWVLPQAAEPTPPVTPASAPALKRAEVEREPR